MNGTVQSILLSGVGAAEFIILCIVSWRLRRKRFTTVALYANTDHDLHTENRPCKDDLGGGHDFPNSLTELHSVQEVERYIALAKDRAEIKRDIGLIIFMIASGLIGAGVLWAFRNGPEAGPEMLAAVMPIVCAYFGIKFKESAQSLEDLCVKLEKRAATLSQPIARRVQIPHSHLRPTRIRSTR